MCTFKNLEKIWKKRVATLYLNKANVNLITLTYMLAKKPGIFENLDFDNLG